MHPYYTPDKLTELPSDGVFVFGSNAEGNHAGGAARDAIKRFGAVMGQGEGLQGQSYAIPTMGTFEELTEAVSRFIQFAKAHPEYCFYLTKIGTGIAGHDENKVKALFGPNLPGNIRLPQEWDNRRYKFLLSKDGKPVSAHGNTKWGETWQKVDGDIEPCRNGFHCSLRMMDALSYVAGEFVSRVEVAGKCVDEPDKQAWEKMRLTDTRKWRKEDSVALSIYAAECVLDNYEKVVKNDSRPRDAVEAAKAWLLDPTEDNRVKAETAASAAWSAALSAAASAWSAANAAWSAEIAAWSAEIAASAASAANAAKSAAKSAAWIAEIAAKSAAWSAASAAWSAEIASISVWLERRFDELPKL